MKRSNHKKDLILYRNVFNIYYDLVSELVKRTDLEIDNLKQEKKLFRPRGQYQKLPSRFLHYCDKAYIKNKSLTVQVDGFTCSFKLTETITIKRRIERKLVTPKHHLYYFRVVSSYQAA